MTIEKAIKAAGSNGQIVRAAWQKAKMHQRIVFKGSRLYRKEGEKKEVYAPTGEDLAARDWQAIK